MPQPLISPDARYALRFTCDPVGSGDYVHCPVLVDIEEQRVLFTLAGTLWTVEVAIWSDDSRMLIMTLRKRSKPSPSICVRVEVEQKQVCLDDSAYSLPLNQLYERLEARYQAWNAARSHYR